MELPAERTSDRDQIYAQNPDFPWLSVTDAAGVESLLRERGWLAAGERVDRCGTAGDGNMNVTLRVTTNRRSIIVKQSRPWVQKYDQIPAPWDRIEYEYRFYQRVQSIPACAARMPRLLHADMAARVLVLEDLAPAQPLTSLYAGETLTPAEWGQLADFLGQLHNATAGRSEPGFDNRELRRLNHEHIFVVPLAPENGLDLDQWEPGLADAAASLRRDADFCRRVAAAGERYLAAGTVLVHGDYFPGSWLRGDHEIFVIDPEFCYFGDAEFDLGCAMAHCCLSQQPRQVAERLLSTYLGHRQGPTLDAAVLSAYAAAEVMRRLIGVAQLPLATEPPQRSAMLARARQAMLSQDWKQLWN